MTNLIKSDTQTALSAVSGFVGLNTTSWQEEQVTFSYTSGIAGMANGLQTANQLIPSGEPIWSSSRDSGGKITRNRC